MKLFLGLFISLLGCTTSLYASTPLDMRDAAKSSLMNLLTLPDNYEGKIIIEGSTGNAPSDNMYEIKDIKRKILSVSLNFLPLNAQSNQVVIGKFKDPAVPLDDRSTSVSCSLDEEGGKVYSCKFKGHVFEGMGNYSIEVQYKAKSINKSGYRPVFEISDIHVTDGRMSM